jgi:hypothetical protein
MDMHLLGGPGLCPDQSMWDLWWTKWHWDRFFSELFGFLLSVSSDEDLILIHRLEYKQKIFCHIP